MRARVAAGGSVWIAPNTTSAIGGRAAKWLAASARSDPEDDPGADRDPPGRDGEPQEPRLDSGRGLVARGQRGREAAEPFGWFASWPQWAPPGDRCRAFTWGFTRFVGTGKRILRPPGRVPVRSRAGAGRLVDSPVVFMVGLTGGIGSGKSTVARHARRAGRRGGRRRRDRARGGRARHAGARRARRGVRARDPARRRVARPRRARRARLRDRRGRASSSRRSRIPAIGEEFLRQVAAAPPDGDRGARRSAARGVEARLRLRRRDRGGGAAGAAPRPARGAGRAARRRRAAHRAAGHRRGAPDGGHLGASTTRPTSPTSSARSTEIWPDARSARAARADAEAAAETPTSRRRRRSSATRTNLTVSPRRYARIVQEFELVTDMEPAGDQPEAIAALVDGRRAAATGSRRCSASPARARASRSPT